MDIHLCHDIFLCFSTCLAYPELVHVTLSLIRCFSDGDSTDVEEDDGSQDQGEVATPSVHPSQEPTIYITGISTLHH